MTKDDFDFVTDRVSKEVLELSGTLSLSSLLEGNTENENRTENENDDDKKVSHVKTAFRKSQPTILVTRKTRWIRKSCGNSSFSSNNTYKNKKCSHQFQSRRRPNISMAPTETAGGLVGFRSGTMSPIYHTTPMELYFKENIANKNKNKSSSNSNINNDCSSRNGY